MASTKRKLSTDSVGSDASAQVAKKRKIDLESLKEKAKKKALNANVNDEAAAESANEDSATPVKSKSSKKQDKKSKKDKKDKKSKGLKKVKKDRKREAKGSGEVKEASEEEEGEKEEEVQEVAEEEEVVEEAKEEIQKAEKKSKKEKKAKKAKKAEAKAEVKAEVKSDVKSEVESEVDSEQLQGEEKLAESSNPQRETAPATVYIEGLPFDWKESDITNVFEEFSQGVSEVRAPTWQDSGRLRGFAHVEFTDENTAKEVIKKYNGHKVNNGRRYAKLTTRN